MEKEFRWEFVEVTAISSDPGNETQRRSIRTGEILDFGQAAARYIPIGGASTIVLRSGGMLVLKESYDELKELLQNAEKEYKK